MITPRFKITQNENTITLVIRAPYCNLRELEISVEENVYLFLCKPYYLRLNLPGGIIENNNTKSAFDSDNGEFTFTYDKVNPGEEFKDLDFITKLLCRKIDVVDGDRKIEVLTSEKNDEANNLPTDLEHGYGFALRGGYAFSAVTEEFSEVFDVNPFEVTLTDRRKLKLQDEKKKFNEDHYLGDHLDEDEIPEIRALNCPYTTIDKENITFTDKELDFLKDLHNIEYNLNPDQIKYCHNSLLDILYAYCYDRRTTFFEGTCESGWTIAKLCSSFCWFEGFSTPKEALISAIRRSLIYPLYREWKLALCVFEDMKTLIKLGEKIIIKCLINIYEIFLGGDCGRYILNNLFIKDYITYVMKWDKKEWEQTVNEVMSIKIEKNDLGLNLLQIEASLNDDLNNQMMNLNLQTKDVDSDDDSESESTEASDTSSSDTSENSSSEEEECKN